MSKNSSSTESIELEKPLIFTDELIAGPLNRFKDVRAFSRLLNNLENEGISGTLLKLQRWSVPAIRRGQNVIMIGPKKCGKTISYVVPLVEFVYVRNITDEVSEQGPSALVLCPNSSDAQDVYEICQALLEETSEEEKVRSRFQAMLLLDGSEVSSIKKYKILITTPECLANHDQLGNFDLQGIKYFILDDIDIASTSKRLEVNVVLEKLHFDNSKKSYQTIIASRHYNSLINDLSSRMRGNYVMFISSYLEAAVSVKMKTHIFYNCDINTKSQLLYDKLINVINHRKILIVCQDDEEILHLTDYFKTTGTSPLIVSNDTGFKNCKDVNRSWKCSSSRSQPVLICTDDVFTDLEIEDAHWLVLFSLSSDTDFESRMSCFKKYFKLKNVEDYKEYKELTIIMFLDDSRRHHLVKAVEFGQRLNADLPPKMLQKCKEILHNKRKARKSDQKRDKSLCADILFQGKCSKAGRCLKRHTLDEELDFPKWPKKGRITFTILNVDNPACYWVRPLEHAETEDEDPVPLKSSSLKINLQLMKYYDVIENRTVLSPVKINYWCSVKDEEDVFHRAQVVNFTKLENNRPTEVKVRLTDKGNLMVVKASEIFRIPKRLSERDPQAAQVIIANVAPYSTDKWSPCANPLVRRLTDEDSDVEITGAGRILLSSGNIMWLDDVQILRSTKSKNSRVVESSIRKILLEKEFAVENKFHLPLLKKLCEDANVSAPRNKLLKKLQPVVEPRWESFNEEVEQATLLYAENSSQIFLRQFNNRKRLDELEEKCQKFVQKIKSETELVTSSCSNEKYCLAYSKTSRRWLRARIDSKIGDEIDVFFVDHGESQYIHSNYIVPLPDDLLVQLPFQVIECRLIGVRHEPESNIDIQNEIYNFFDGGRELIYVNVIRENSTAQLTGGKRYDVNLLNLLGKSLNRHLINNKFPREESELSLIKNFKLTSVRDDLD